MKTSTRIRPTLYRHPLANQDWWAGEFHAMEMTVASFIAQVQAASKRGVRTIVTQSVGPSFGSVPMTNELLSDKPADTAAVLLDRLGDAPERTINRVLDQVAAGRARHASDTAAADTTLTDPPPPATADELTQRSYFGQLVATSLAGATSQRALALAKAAAGAPDVINNPQYAAAWADRLEAMRAASLNDALRPGADITMAMRDAQELNMVIETLRRPSQPADRRLAADAIELLRKVGNHLTWVERTVRPRVEAITTRPGQWASDQMLTNRFGGIWELEYQAPDQRRRYGGYASPVELATALAGRGMTPSAALDWYLTAIPDPKSLYTA